MIYKEMHNVNIINYLKLTESINKKKVGMFQNCNKHFQIDLNICI